MKTVTISIHKGVITECDVPEDVEVFVWDFDVDGMDDEFLMSTDEGDQAHVTRYTSDTDEVMSLKLD